MIYDKFLEGNQNIKINIKIHSRSINKIRGISDEESEWRKKKKWKNNGRNGKRGYYHFIFIINKFFNLYIKFECKFEYASKQMKYFSKYNGVV